MDHLTVTNRTIAVFNDVIAQNNMIVSEKTQKEEIDSWDSMNHLIFMAELESAFGIRFTIDEITQSDCLEMIISAIEHKLEI